MYGKKKYILILIAITFAIVLLTGSASRHNSVQQEPDTFLTQEENLDWANRPATDPAELNVDIQYYSTLCIDEPPTLGESEI